LALATLIVVREGRDCVVLETHGVVTSGGSLEQAFAFDRLEVLETTSEALINSRALGGALPMSSETIAELEAAFGMPSRGPPRD